MRARRCCAACRQRRRRQTDADGSSRITTPDYAAGIVDHLENPAAHRKQITFAC
jgi:putative NADH-flavin reductase